MGKIKKNSVETTKTVDKKAKKSKSELNTIVEDKKTIKRRTKEKENGLQVTLKKSKTKTKSKIGLILKDIPLEEINIDVKSKKNFEKTTKIPQTKIKALKTKKPKVNKYEEFENKFNIKANDVEKAVQGVITFVQTNPKLKNTLFNEEFPLFLQINCFKVPKGHTKIIRIALPNSLLTAESEVCLIVPEIKGVSNREHDRHKEYYEELLSKNNITNIKQIFTFHELRTEYETFELKKRLVDLYDTFLVDGRISGKVVRFCGSIFYKKRKVPTSVKLDSKQLKQHLETALKKTQFQLHLKGDSYMVQFGHSGMKIDELVENVYTVVDNLNTQFPGKIDNIRGINVYANRATPLPIYLSLKSPNNVAVPVNKTKRPKLYKSYTDELSTKLNTEVTVRPTGEVIVHKKSTGYKKEAKGITVQEENEDKRKIEKKSNKSTTDELNTELNTEIGTTAEIAVPKKLAGKKRKAEEKAQEAAKVKTEKKKKERKSNKCSTDELNTMLNSEVPPTGEVTVSKKLGGKKKKVEKPAQEKVKVKKEQKQKMEKKSKKTVIGKKLLKKK